MHSLKRLAVLTIVAFISFCLVIGCADQSTTPIQNGTEQLNEISYSDAEVEKLIKKITKSLRNSLQTSSSIEKVALSNPSQKKYSAGYVRIDDEINGILYSMIKPDNWNGDLVLLVHGSIPEVSEFLANAFANMGYGVAGVGIGNTTVIRGENEASALKDVTLLTSIIQEKFNLLGKPERTYLLSFSRGAHNAKRLLEKSSPKYAGYLSICGGNGGSQMAWDRFFTSRVLFDYFFPGVLPGSPTKVPQISEEQFITDLAPQIVNAIISNPDAALELGNVDQYNLKFDSFDELVEGIVTTLVTHTIGVNDLIRTANGNPFDNSETIYSGSSDDVALNATLQRLKADRQSREFLKSWYEPRGTISNTPLIMLHTSRDPSTPENLHNDKYEKLLNKTGNADSYIRRTVDRFGHCAFSAPEIFSNFADLAKWAETGLKPTE